MARNAARRWSVGVVCAAAVVAATLGWSAAPASAHNYPIGSSPEEGSVVTEQPGLFTVTTNDLLLDLDGTGAGNAMRITGPKGVEKPLYYGDGCVTVSGATAESEARLGQPGEYTVTWQVVSTDGHPVSGSYSFTWQPAEGKELAAGSTTAPDCDGTATEKPGQATTGQSATDAAGSGASAGGLADVAWIAGALGVVIIFAGGTLLVVRRRKTAPSDGQSDAQRDARPDTPPDV